MKPSIPFYILDVFAQHPYQGNQLAVFDTRNQQLSHKQMQLLAKEINFQESTFVTKSDDVNCVYEVKIFTPETELSFAGHPTIGTAWVVQNILNLTQPKSLILSLGIGKITVIEKSDLLWFTATQPEFLEEYYLEDITSFTNLSEKDFDINFPIEKVSTGTPFIIVCLQSIEALAKLKIEITNLKNWISKQNVNHHFHAFYFFCEQENSITARMLFIENGLIKEDAATGSAASCLLAYLLKQKQNHIETFVEQGNYMNRPAKIYLNGEKFTNHYNIQIGGSTHFIAKGEWLFNF